MCLVQRTAFFPISALYKLLVYHFLARPRLCVLARESVLMRCIMSILLRAADRPTDLASITGDGQKLNL